MTDTTARETAVAVLEADCVGVRYGSTQVLTSASLRAYPGRTMAFVGRNGSGKSSLLRVITGSQAPDTGYVRLLGRPMLTTTLDVLARQGVFFLPDRELLHGAMAVGRQIAAAGEAFGHDTDLAGIGKALGIERCLDKRPAALSTGERRRAEVAVAMARQPDVLIADEPLRSVDPIDAEIILEAIREYARQGGSAIVTGHEMPLLLAHVDTVTWCASGTTREFPSVAAAMDDFAFHQGFLTSFVGQL